MHFWQIENEALSHFSANFCYLDRLANDEVVLIVQVVVLVLNERGVLSWC